MDVTKIIFKYIKKLLLVPENTLKRYLAKRIGEATIDFNVLAGKSPKNFHVEYLPTSGAAVRHNTCSRKR